MTTSTDPHEWADSMAEWAVQNPSPAPRIPRMPADACSGIEDEPPYNQRRPFAPAKPRTSYVWHAVVIVCLACAWLLITY